MNDNNSNLKDQLRDIAIPDPVSWWPLAPGWWFLIACLVGLLCLWGLYAFRQWQKKAYLRQAVRELNELNKSKYLTPLDKFNRSQEVMKRVVNQTPSLTEGRSLSGSAWLEFLEKFSDSRMHRKILFTEKHTDLIDLGYRKDHGSVNLEPWIADCTLWVKRLNRFKV